MILTYVYTQESGFDKNNIVMQKRILITFLAVVFKLGLNILCLPFRPQCNLCCTCSERVLHWTNGWNVWGGWCKSYSLCICPIRTTILSFIGCFDHLYFFFGGGDKETFFYLLKNIFVSHPKKFLAGNQDNHQNLVPSLISKNLGLVFMGMADSKKLSFSKSAFCKNFRDWSLD